MIPEADLVRWLFYILGLALAGAGVAGVGNRIKNRGRRDDIATLEARLALGQSQFEAEGSQEAHKRALAYQGLAMTERERAHACELKLEALEVRVVDQEKQLRNLGLILLEADPGAERYLKLQQWFRDSGPSEL